MRLFFRYQVDEDLVDTFFKIGILRYSFALATSSSSRGLGHRPFTAVTRVQIPLGTPGEGKQFSLSELILGPVAQLVSAPPCHGGGRGFKSRLGRDLFLFGWVAQLVRACD